MERDWRDAKIPQWVKDAIAAETKAHRLTAALSWPAEAKPQPLPFKWGAYDQLHGEARDGVFYHPWRIEDVEVVHIKRNAGSTGRARGEWEFSHDGHEWTTRVVRGPLFETERNARLYVLWCACEEYAAKLMAIRGQL